MVIISCIETVSVEFSAFAIGKNCKASWFFLRQINCMRNSDDGGVQTQACTAAWGVWWLRDRVLEQDIRHICCSRYWLNIGNGGSGKVKQY